MLEYNVFVSANAFIDGRNICSTFNCLINRFKYSLSSYGKLNGLPLAFAFSLHGFVLTRIGIILL